MAKLLGRTTRRGGPRGPPRTHGGAARLGPQTRSASSFCARQGRILSRNARPQRCAFASPNAQRARPASAQVLTCIEVNFAALRSAPVARLCAVALPCAVCQDALGAATQPNFRTSRGVSANERVDVFGECRRARLQP